ncbi:MAG: glycosyltransferase, partial [bacterium]
FVSHPIDPAMRYTGSIKQATVVAVGRWDDAVKCPDTLVSVASQVLVRHPTVQFILVGTQATRCAAAIAAKIPSAQNRVVGHEYLDHDQLCEKMNSSQISLCTSHSESFHIPSGEALLCGCTVVGPCSPLLPALDYFVEGGTSGRLAANTPQDLAEAVLAELAAWRQGLRVPATLSAVWRERLAARVVVSRIERLLFDPSEEGSAVPRSKT